MKAVVYTGDHASEFRDVDAPATEENQTIVDLSFCGICGSDMHAWHGKDERRIPPLVLGHEAVGRAMDGPHAGRLVAINPLMRCGACPACTSGAEHLCASRELIGMRVPGAFAEAVAVDTANLTVLPEGVNLADIALAEPLACALHTIHLGQAALSSPLSDQRMVILGGGAIGLLTALAAHYYDCNKSLMVTNDTPERFGTVTTAATYNLFQAVPDAAENCDILIDAVGSGLTRKAASALVRPGGVIVHIGFQDNLDGLDTRRFTLQEITFR